MIAAEGTGRDSAKRRVSRRRQEWWSEKSERWCGESNAGSSDRRLRPESDRFGSIWPKFGTCRTRRRARNTPQGTSVRTSLQSDQPTKLSLHCQGRSMGASGRALFGLARLSRYPPFDPRSDRRIHAGGVVKELMSARDLLTRRWKTPSRVENGVLRPPRRRFPGIQAHFARRFDAHSAILDHAGSGGGCDRKRPIRRRIFSNSARRTATSASWNTAYRPCRTILAPIFTSFSRKVVSDQCSTSLGRARARRKLARL